MYLLVYSIAESFVVPGELMIFFFYNFIYFTTITKQVLQLILNMLVGTGVLIIYNISKRK